MIGLMSPVDKQKETSEQRADKLQEMWKEMLHTHHRYFDKEIIKKYLIAKAVDKEIARRCLLRVGNYFTSNGFTGTELEWFGVAISFGNNPYAFYPFQILIHCGGYPAIATSKYVGLWHARILEVKNRSAELSLKRFYYRSRAPENES